MNFDLFFDVRFVEKSGKIRDISRPDLSFAEYSPDFEMAQFLR
jgi:hypothetical protein